MVCACQPPCPADAAPCASVLAPSAVKPSWPASLSPPPKAPTARVLRTSGAAPVQLLHPPFPPLNRRRVAFIADGTVLIHKAGVAALEPAAVKSRPPVLQGAHPIPHPPALLMFPPASRRAPPESSVAPRPPSAPPTGALAHMPPTRPADRLRKRGRTAPTRASHHLGPGCCPPLARRGWLALSPAG